MERRRDSARVYAAGTEKKLNIAKLAEFHADVTAPDLSLLASDCATMQPPENLDAARVAAGCGMRLWRNPAFSKIGACPP
jgi:hypothetical protein